MFLYEIQVLPSHRCRGVGRALIEELQSIARNRDCDEMFVMTSAANRAAMRLYASAGGVREAGDDVLFVYPAKSERADI